MSRPSVHACRLLHRPAATSACTALMVQATEESALSSERFLELLQAAAHPTASTVSSESLAESLGISALPTGQEAIELVKTDVLSPPKDLAGLDLWRWQAPLPCPVPLPSLPLDSRPPTHIVAPSFRGIDGNFTRWRDALAPRPPAHPSLSSSMNREHAPAGNFVRGKSTNAPFLPGGLEPAITYEEAEEELEEEDGWKTRAPGFRRGVQLDGGGTTAVSEANRQPMISSHKFSGIRA